MCRVDYDGETSTVHNSKIVNARKSHRCDECRREIKAGESYRYDFTVYDGHARSFHTCQHCLVICRWLSTNCEGYTFTDAISDFAEHAEEYPDLAHSILPIVQAARQQWRGNDGSFIAVPDMPPEISVAEAA